MTHAFIYYNDKGTGKFVLQVAASIYWGQSNQTWQNSETIGDFPLVPSVDIEESVEEFSTIKDAEAALAMHYAAQL